MEIVHEIYTIPLTENSNCSLLSVGYLIFVEFNIEDNYFSLLLTGQKHI